TAFLCLGPLAAAAHASPTRAEYVVQVDPVCAAATRDIGRINRHFRHLHKRGRYRAAGATLRETGTRLAASVDHIRAIPPPSGDEATVTQWLSLVDRVAADNRRMGRAEAHRKFHAVRRLQAKNARVANRAHLLIQSWGFYACTGNPQG